jgi:uncharacterized RDD family membrane protein YckC
MPDERPSSPAADRAVSLLRRYEAERAERPAYRAQINDRLIARLIDGAIVFVVGVIIVLAIPSSDESDGIPRAQQAAEEREWVVWGPVKPQWPGVFAILGFAGLVAFYDVAATKLFGNTLGKRVTGLVVVEASTMTPAGPLRIVARDAIWAVPFSFTFLNLFSSVFYTWVGIAVVLVLVYWHRRERSGGRPLWDVIAGTQVVDRDLGRSQHPHPHTSSPV